MNERKWKRQFRREAGALARSRARQLVIPLKAKPKEVATRSVWAQEVMREFGYHQVRAEPVSDYYHTIRGVWQILTFEAVDVPAESR